MTTALKVFENSSFGSIRTLQQNEEVLFVAADVCKALEIKNATQAVDRLDEDEKAMLNIGLRGGDTNVVNEYGLYSLVLTSRKPEAKAFKRWITHEVIPAIRKTGAYSSSSHTKEMLAEAKLNNSRARLAAEFRKIAERTEIPEYKAICHQKAAEALTGAKLLPMQEVQRRTYSATEIGKQLGISAMKVGQLAKRFNLKTPEYGKYFYDKAKNSNKEVETFRYYENAVKMFRHLLASERLVMAAAQSSSEEEFMRNFGGKGENENA